MGRWFFRLAGDAPTPPTVPPHDAPTVAVDQPKATTKAILPAADYRYQDKIRELLRLEFECAAGVSLKKGNLTAAKILSKLAKTTGDVEVNVLYAYAQLLDDIASPAVSSDELRQIGFGWFPKNAAEYVERLVHARESGRSSVHEAD